MDKKIGFDACVEKIGRSFYELYKDNAVFCCGQESAGLFCFLGLNTTEQEDNSCIRLSLDSKSSKENPYYDDWEYYASCIVNNGEVIMDKCRVPNKG